MPILLPESDKNLVDSVQLPWFKGLLVFSGIFASLEP